MKRKSIEVKTQVAIKNLHIGDVCSSYVSLEFQSIGSAFGIIFNDYIKELKLPDGHNYQNYLLNDSYYQGYYSLSLGTNSEKWFATVNERKNKDEVIKLCNIFTNKLLHLFEGSLMEQDKTRVSFQLKVLSFIQSNGIKELVLNINDDLKHDS